jgi:hypothetical protein
MAWPFLKSVCTKLNIMRKFLLFSTALLFAAGSVIAQPRKKANTFASHISLGPVVSLGHSWVSNIPYDRDFKFSPAAGIGLVYSTNEHLGFGAQLLVSHEGYKQEIPRTAGGVADVTINPVYLRVPLHLIYFFGDFGDRVRPKIYIGPSLAFKVDETRKYTDPLMEAALANREVFEDFDIGLTAGLGANVRLSRLTWLNLDLGYYNGLVDVMNVPTTGDGFNGNRNLRLNVGLMWGL